MIAKSKKGGRHRWAIRLALAGLLGPLCLILLFRFVPPPVTPLMLVRWVQGYGIAKEWVPYARTPPALTRALIASEDNLFCAETFGIDVEALNGQVENLQDGEPARGASTITMQTVKNLLLWPGRDFVRKGIELWLTPQLAVLWPKQRVLEVYLNIVEFGPGIYGAGAAARAFWGKNVEQLTPREAALLAVVLPDPLHWSAGKPGPYVRSRASIIERRAAQLGSLLDCVR